MMKMTNEMKRAVYAALIAVSALGQNAAADGLAGSNEDYFVSVETGDNTACGLTHHGKIWCWGQSDIDTGERGAGEASTEIMSPNMVTGIDRFVSSSLNYLHQCGIAADGSGWCWGKGFAGQRGDGRNDSKPEFSPQPVYGLKGVTSIATGFAATCATTADGKAWCWGDSYRGQRGDGTRTKIHSVPAPVKRITEVKQVAMGIDHACAIAKDHQVWCWGSNTYGQIGDGSWDLRLSLKAPLGPIAEEVDVVTEAVQVSVGNLHSCAVTKYGDAYCWGRGDEGQQGNGTFDEKVTQARKVSGLVGVSAISAGRNHTCAIRGIGEVWCWGLNRFGQLGIPPQEGQEQSGKFASPIKVEGLPIMEAISAGDQFTCAVDIFGRIWCWGKNTYRQTGSGEAKVHVWQPAMVGFPSEPCFLPGRKHAVEDNRCQ